VQNRQIPVKNSLRVATSATAKRSERRHGQGLFLVRAQIPEAADRAAFDHWHGLRAPLEGWLLYPALRNFIGRRL
jgi:hypothetical protein